MGPEDVDGNTTLVRQAKTGARLVLPLQPELAALLTKTPPFLQTEGGKAFTPNSFYIQFKGWYEEAGLAGDRSPHELKAAARRLAKARCMAHRIAAITGHATFSEIQRYTIAVDQKALARAAFKRVVSNLFED